MDIDKEILKHLELKYELNKNWMTKNQFKAFIDYRFSREELGDVQSDSKFLRENIQDIFQKKVIDVGCGTGDLVINLAWHNIDIIGIDMSENDIGQLEYDEIKKIQDPEPIIIIPENLAPFVPKNIIYLTKFVPKDLNIKRFKAFQKKRLEEKIPYSKKEKLIDKKAGVVRTINELKLLKDSNEIDVDKFAELKEKYSTKLKMIDSALEKLVKRYRFPNLNI